MGKKSEKKLIDKVLKIKEREDIVLKKQVSIFYEDGELVYVKSTSETDPFISIFSTLKKDNTKQTFTKEQLLQKCLQIREYVKQGKKNNVEIDLQTMVERFDGFSHELQTTLIRVLAMDAKKPVYVQVTKGDLLHSSILIGTDEELAFLLTKDVDGNDAVIRLSEMNLLSFNEKPTTEEFCLVTIYSWRRAILFTGIIMDSLKVVKQLLSSEKTKKLYLEPPKTNKITKGTTTI